MRSRRTRFALFVMDLSVAVAAIVGGATIALGLDSFPREWLASSPFSDYVLPGLLLAVAVGGCAAVAAIATARDPRLGAMISVLAGLVLAGWIAGEVVLLNQNSAATSPRSPVEAIFLLLGLAMVVLGAILWGRSRREPAA